MLEKFRRSSVVERNSDVDERGVGFENLDAPTFRAPDNVEDIRQRCVDHHGLGTLADQRLPHAEKQHLRECVSEFVKVDRVIP
ncbi:MAG: hypothetical protein ACKOLA_05290 [Spartobacteria bacterium]